MEIKKTFHKKRSLFMNNSIFRTYDIRGTVPDQLTPELYYKFGRAFIEFTNAREVAVGRDPRLSSPDFHQSLIRGLNEAGANVIDLGMVPIELVYFSVGHLKLDGGLMITASHSPKEYNGLKLIGKDAISITSLNGLEEIQRVMSLMFRDSHPERSEGSRFEFIQDSSVDSRQPQNDKLIQKDIWPEYVKKILSLIDVKKNKPLKVVVDAGNGLGGLLIDHIKSYLPIEIIPLYFDPDGRFPNHQPNPIIPENRIELEKSVREKRADIGAALDTDCDRVAFVDENGDFIQTDFIGALLTDWFIGKEKNAKIVYDLRRGWAIKDIAQKQKVRAWQTCAGYPFIKEKMRETGAIFGFEASGHHFFRDLYYADSGLIPFLLTLSILSESQKKLSELVKPMREQYFMIEEENFTVNDPKLTFVKMKKKYSDGQISELDGISVEYPDWHFNLRASNTEPVIRLNLEARSQKNLDEKYLELKKIIES